VTDDATTSLKVLHSMDNNNQIHYCWVTNTTCVENDNWHNLQWTLHLQVWSRIQLRTFTA